MQVVHVFTEATLKEDVRENRGTVPLTRSLNTRRRCYHFRPGEEAVEAIG
jgi:hypothetical protein